MLRKYRFTILFISWVVFITSLSLFSFSDLDTGSVNIPFADKITHLVFYAVFVILGCLGLREANSAKFGLKRAIWIAILVAIGYGILIEVLQYTLTKDRMAEYGDALANAIGACLGGFIIWWYFSKKEPLKWKI